MSELNKITHDPKVIKTLEEKGILSLEQIALSTPELLGLPDTKAKQINASALNVIAEENIENIEIKTMAITINLKSNNRAVFNAINFVLNSDIDSCVMRQNGNSIMLEIKSGKKNKFLDIKKKAEVLNNFILLKRKEKMKEEGITIPYNEIIKFAKEKKFEGFYSEFFSDITGNELMKKTITVALFSNFEEPVHILVLGDPGSAKTLARDLLIKNLSGINSIGANATKSGLVCNLSNGELGALAVSDKKLVLMDEFDKINKNDLEFCYELLSNGKCSVHSARVHKDIVSRIILIAFGNPKSNVFNDAMPLDDIGMEKTLLSRFAFIIRTDTLNKNEKGKLFKDKLLGKSKLSEHIGLFDQWIKLARTHRPKMLASETKIDELVSEAIEIVEKHGSTQLRRDLRMGDYLRRIAMAFARIDFSDVTDETIDHAYNLIKASIDIWDFKMGRLDFLD